MFDDHPDLFAAFKFGALSAGLIPPAHTALADLTERFAVRRFYAVDTAAFAVDHVGRDFDAVERRPVFGDFLPQRIVTVHRGDPGLAGLAVEPAECDEFFHIRFLR